MGTAQVRPDYAHLYPALGRGQWYPVSGGTDPGDIRALRLHAGTAMVDVAAEHVAHRRGAEER